MIKQKITPFLWFANEASEAAKLYTSLFKDSDIKNISKLEDTPSGSVETVSIELAGEEFSLMSAGPLFKFNPSISFFIACSSKEEVQDIWDKLSPGGKPLMELSSYPFSDKYGWIQDKFGLSWQVMYMGGRPFKQKIIPTLMFVGKVCGKAEEAINFYNAVFHSAKTGDIMRYGDGEEPDKIGTIRHAEFSLEGQEFAAMDSAHRHEFAFNEAISFVVNCETQEEIDYYWEKLSFDPKAERCGWLKDKYGVSWQIVPTVLGEMLSDPDPNRVARVTQAFLPMRRLDIVALKNAYESH